MDSPESQRVAANMMIASGNDTLPDGSKLTMELFDSWDEDEQRAFVCKFLCERWGSLSPQQQADEVLQMPQKCHACGASGDGAQLTADAAVGFTKLQCAACALKAPQQEPSSSSSAEDQKMLVVVRPHPEWGWDPAPKAPVRVHGLSARADLNGQTGKLYAHVHQTRDPCGCDWPALTIADFDSRGVA